MERAPQACSNLFSSYARGFVVFRNAHTRRRLPRAAQILSLFFEEGDTSPYIYIYIYTKGFVPWFLDSLEVVWTLRVRVSPLTFTFTHAHASSLSPPSPPLPPVLYNATIDSRPLFHARDLLQSLQPVSGDSVQCPVSLPVSVRKIYFPMRYTGWLGENSSRSISPIPSPLLHSSSSPARDIS